MYKALLILKIVVALAVLGTMGVTVAFVNKVSDALNPEVTPQGMKKMLQDIERVDLKPGEKAFSRASNLLVTGNLVEGRERLLYITNFHPTTRSAPEARRILGEMNMDQLLSPKDMSNKSVYTVKRGDNFFNLCRDNKMTLDLLMMLNQLKTTSNLQIGEELVVMSVDFRVEIDREKNSLTLWDDNEFIKHYVIKKFDVEALKGTRTTSISGKGAYHGSKRHTVLQQSKYRTGNKSLSMKGIALELRCEEDATEEGSQAIYLANADMEELAMLLRLGNEVVIRSANN